MKLSSLKNMLNRKIKPSDFIQEISHEINEYIRQSSISGSSKPISVQEDILWNFRLHEMINLLEMFLVSDISETELEYICDGLELSEAVNYNEQVSEILFLVSNPDINDRNTKDKIRKIIEEFNKKRL